MKNIICNNIIANFEMDQSNQTKHSKDTKTLIKNMSALTFVGG